MYMQPCRDITHFFYCTDAAEDQFKPHRVIQKKPHGKSKSPKSFTYTTLSALRTLSALKVASSPGPTQIFWVGPGDEATQKANGE